MLGSGRPFLLECVDPTKMISAKKNEVELAKYVSQYSPYVSANGTKFVDKTYFEVLKNMETDKIKEYCCVVWTQNKLTKEGVEKLNHSETIKVSLLVNSG